MPLRLHELAHRIAALGDIEEIVTAMRSLAFVELRRLVETISHQRETLAARERAIGELLAHHPQSLSETSEGNDVLLAIGSERGFCGDFNTQLVAALRQSPAAGKRLLVVGARLALALVDEDMAHEPLRGATVSEEVPRVLQQIAAALSGDGDSRTRPSGLVVLHHGSDSAIVRERLLPSPAPPRQPEPRTPLQLQLPPRELFQALMDQYLLGRLNAALLVSLHAENHRRLEHTGAAIDRLDRELDTVQRQRRRARQEAITEEIEIMLLGAQDANADPATRPSPTAL
jgi:F-type H+-transporting ATPase subunit gamma